MNVFNRVAMSLILLAFIVVTLLFAFVPGYLIQMAREALTAMESGLGPATRLIGGVVGVVLAALAAMLLWSELRPPTRKSVLVVKGAGGTAELSNESVALRVRRAAEGVAGVREALPVIHSRGRSVDILLRLATDPDIDLPRKTEEVMQAVRAETETNMGIPIKSLKVTVRHGKDRGSAPPPSTLPTRSSDIESP